jgi:hypothetical protein
MKILHRLLILAVLLIILYVYCSRGSSYFESFQVASSIEVVQTDNRDNLDYLILSQRVNQRMCDYLKYSYNYIKMDASYTKDVHPATAKVLVLNDYLQKTDKEIIIFIDSDAWIQNPDALDSIVSNLKSSSANGCFSRDVYCMRNTYINSGGFILKVNDYVKGMYSKLSARLNTANLSDEHFKRNWPYDQNYISNYVYGNRSDFIIYKPNILNQPDGLVIRHNWLKNKAMYDDMNNLLVGEVGGTSLELNGLEDTEDYPSNKDAGGPFCF